MYLKMFGLKEKPFHITPNPRFIFLSKKHKEAFAHLLYGVRQRVGFLSLVGEVGTGKTTVLRTLLCQLEQANYQVALIFNPCLSSLELLQSIHREFDIPYQEGDRNLASLHDSLNDFLLEQRKQGKTVVLVIDEAQNLDSTVLEQLRLLSNLETATDKLLQLIIVGQPELDEVLNRRELRQLKQRLAVRYRLTTMDAEDTEAYVRHRLKIAGFGGAKLFTDKALKKIYRLTDGLPRLINILCDRALLVAYSNEQHLVNQRGIAEAQKELSGGDLVKRRRWPWAAVVGLTCVLAFLFGYFQPLFLGSAQHSSVAITDSETALTQTSARLRVEQAPAGKEIIDLQRLEALKQKVASFGEAESAKISISAVLQRWGKSALKNYTAKAYQPLEGALGARGMNTIRFQNSPQKLLDFNTPAILTILLPNLKGKRYLALMKMDGDRALIKPALTEDGWISLSYLEALWFGRALIPWNNYERLPYLDTPGKKGREVRRIQELLGLAGYPELKLTGIYDRETIQVVSDLQQKNGLNPDGRIGAQTLLQVYRLVGLDIPQLAQETAQ